MKYLNLFENYESDIKILKKAKQVMSSYKDTPAWNVVIETLNEADIDYFEWNDFDVLIYYLENYDESV